MECKSSDASTGALTLQLLEWIGERPRSYEETLETWKTSCPRLTIWDDAVSDGLARVERGFVVVTPAGREWPNFRRSRRESRTRS